MPSGIYKILNKTTGKFYIGSAVNIKSRWRRHKHDLRNNNHQNIHLQRAWNKYGEIDFDFSVIEICSNTELLIKEQVWLNWTNCFNTEIGFNLTPTAGNSLGVKHSAETRKRMSEASKNRSCEHRTKLSLARKGKKHTTEHKIKISLLMKGKILTAETKAKISKGNTGKIRTEETKLKISAGNKNLGTKRGKYKPRQDFLSIMNAPPLGIY